MLRTAFFQAHQAIGGIVMSAFSLPCSLSPGWQLNRKHVPIGVPEALVCTA